ncbi:MAG: winged helix-turn-helix domain-containing protein [Thermodesulfovibrionales bacterium]
MKKRCSPEKHKPKHAHRSCEISGNKREDYELKGRIWVEGKDGTFLGYGRVVLLERIKQYGSISEAARSMNMSYRHAWELVESMNKQAKTPLVETATGGKGGGGAQLTEAGERAIEAFWRLYKKFGEFLRKEVIGI